MLKKAIFVGLMLTGLSAGLCQAGDGSAEGDWANLGRYRSANAALSAPAQGERRVVFMGDSITEFWSEAAPEMFRNKAFINRGISGQTTPQMLIRFRADVIDLHPEAVVILAGTNDIAGNVGPVSNEVIAGNIASMCDLARSHGIKVVLAAVVPAYDYDWAPGLKPAPRIAALNRWIKEFAAQNGYVYVDYYTPMADERPGLKKEYSDDGVHPNAAGYAVMKPLAEKAIAAALGAK